MGGVFAAAFRYSHAMRLYDKVQTLTLTVSRSDQTAWEPSPPINDGNEQSRARVRRRFSSLSPSLKMFLLSLWADYLHSAAAIVDWTPFFDGRAELVVEFSLENSTLPHTREGPLIAPFDAFAFPFRPILLKSVTKRMARQFSGVWQGHPILPFEHVSDLSYCFQFLPLQKAEFLSPSQQTSSDRVDRMKVGFLSADLRRDLALGRAFAAAFDGFAQTKIEVFVFLLNHALSKDQNATLMQEKQNSYVNFHLVSLERQSDELIAKTINDRAVHIVVDMNGFTMSGRPAVLAARPAPVQWAAQGYAASYGSSELIDHYLSDRVASPPEVEWQYEEARPSQLRVSPS